MMLMACETVARSASAGLWDRDGSEMAYADLGGGEAEAGLVPLLDRLLRRGRVTALAVAAGPGSFTGLRIGITALRTLAWIEDLPVHAVDSLAARAAEEGDGLWWVLMPLKRDTTFHGTFRVSAGQVEVLAGSVASSDASPASPALPGAIAIGPALASKPGLARAWCPGIECGSAAGLTARGVARIAPQVEARSWDRLLPAYHQEPAPVLQRRAGVS